MASFLLTARAYLRFVDPDAAFDPWLGVDPALPIVSSLGNVIAGLLVGLGTGVSDRSREPTNSVTQRHAQTYLAISHWPITSILPFLRFCVTCITTTDPKLGNGCTTGHGICGLARFSRRSLAAVCSFMATGMLSATACSPLCPLWPNIRGSPEDIPYPTERSSWVGLILTSLATGAALPALLCRIIGVGTEGEDTGDGKRGGGVDTPPPAGRASISGTGKFAPASLSATVFASGLALSQMTKGYKIFGFLNMKGLGAGTWDGTLVCVMGGGFLVSFVSYQFVRGWNVIKNPAALSCPLVRETGDDKFNVPTNRVIDANLVVGSMIFGLGWGIGGLCPGTLSSSLLFLI